MDRKRIRSVIVGGSVALALSGCVGGGSPEPGAAVASEPGAAVASQPAKESTPTVRSETAAPATGVKVVSQLVGSDVEMTVHPVQVEGGLALVEIDYVAPTDDAGQIAGRISSLSLVLAGGSITHMNSAPGIRLLDAEAGTLIPVALEPDGTPASTYEQERGSGVAHATSTGIFAAPTGDTVTVLVPSLGYVANVPVVPADARFAAATSDIADVANPRTFDLRAFQVSYDESSSTRAQGENITVTLTSDVLFASSSAELSAAAAGAVDAAVAQIRDATETGVVDVVGHTDDVDTDAVNQTLSEQRAAAVAAALGAGLGDGFDVRAQGRGESEPIVSGISPEARAANRRVEISFTGTLAPARKSGPDAIPETDVPTGVAGTPLEVTAANGATYSIVADGFERHGGQILGTLRLDLVSGEGFSNLAGLFVPAGDGGGITIGRGFDSVRQVVSVHGFALLTEQGRTYPFDYETGTAHGSPLRRLVGDEFLVFNPETVGETTMVTVVWPDTGGDEVTVELPGKFRITGIPVSDIG